MEENNFDWENIGFESVHYRTEMYNYTANVVNTQDGWHYTVYENYGEKRSCKIQGVHDEMVQAMLRCQDIITKMLKDDKVVNDYKCLMIRLNAKDDKFEKFKKETHEFYEKELRELMIRLENAEAKANKRVPSFEEFVEWTEQRNSRIKNILATDKRRIHDFFTGKSYIIKTCPEVMEAWRKK